VTEEGDVSETVTMPPMRPVDVAAREGSEAAVGESVFDISGLTVRYGGVKLNIKTPEEVRALADQVVEQVVAKLLKQKVQQAA